jgi:hypothetical protein
MAGLRYVDNLVAAQHKQANAHVVCELPSQWTPAGGLWVLMYSATSGSEVS